MKPLHFALVAGEASGDILGAGLIRQLRSRYPDAEFSGIGGPLMVAEGLQSHYAMEHLSVMGLVEVLGSLRKLLGIRRSLRDRFVQERPDLFIGIDAPDFNIGLEGQLKRHGIPTVHYVSPSVWAWRQGRVKKLRKTTDLILALFPFEAEFYRNENMNVRFVGHPLADQLPLEPDKTSALSRLGLANHVQRLAVLPGSRGSEVRMLAPLFLRVMELCHQRDPALEFLIPAANASRLQELKTVFADARLPLRLFDGQSRDVMAASDAVLLASGTAALEAMLLKKPMVVSYRVAPLTHWILRRLVRVPYVSLPNLLAQRQLVPELLQDQAQPEPITELIMERFQNPELVADLQSEFKVLHLQLQQNASQQAAEACAELVESRRG